MAPEHLPVQIAVVGGGAAGFFAAISAAQENPDAKVAVYEKSGRFLSKVKVSGGGRCNVTHACFEPKDLIKRYPRGSKELLGSFYTWQPRDMVEWLESRGAELKTESDGRMFPVTDSSQTIIDCLTETAMEFKIALHTHIGIERAQIINTGEFELRTSKDDLIRAQRLILATGGGKSGKGHGLAQAFGHTIAPIAPSLFTFHIDDPRLAGLQGLSVPHARVTCHPEDLSQSGPMLITHWGLSGPAILKLSAWGARRLLKRDYQFDLHVNWTGSLSLAQAKEAILSYKRDSGAKQIGSLPLFKLPKRLWERFLLTSDIEPSAKLSQLGKDQIATLAKEIVDCQFQVTGKSMNKEEFVSCGGVALDEIDFKRMESKKVPKLYFAGETLDIDGLTGGFNFQAAWTTGFIAGTAAAQ